MVMLEWTVTPWRVERGRWAALGQPIVLVEGEPPFFAAEPQAYIDKLIELYERADLVPGPFHRLIGEFKDLLEQQLWEDQRCEKQS